MTLSWIVEFTGLAMLYAALSTGLVLGTARVLNWVDSWRAAPFLLITLFFLFLSQHPFPIPDQLDCPVPSAEPQVTLFGFWNTFVSLYQDNANTIDWLSNKTVVSTTMNLLLCMAIGAALARHVTRIWIALTIGAGLTLSVELTQLTGIWGLYPCAYRQFNVDDLFLNAVGVVTGFVMIHAKPLSKVPTIFNG